jgi:hypothetical protein
MAKADLLGMCRNRGVLHIEPDLLVGVSIMAEGTGRGERFSIWFFVGVLPLLYGLILFPYGIYEALGHEAPTALHELHPTMWWGLLLLLFGAFYVIRFRPGKG